MGRNTENPIRKFFKIDKIAGNGKCLINECNTVIKGDHAANFERHVKRFHNKEYEEYLLSKSLASTTTAQNIPSTVSGKRKHENEASVYDMFKKQKCIPVGITEEELEDACVELVTKNNFPFSILECSGFKKIIDPLLSGMKSKKSINVNNIGHKVENHAKNIKQEIINETKNIMVCLKLDIASRLDRSILGINIQYVLRDKIILRTLAMREMKERHTSAYIKDVVMQVLELYEISLHQIYTITTDNGANMV